MTLPATDTWDVLGLGGQRYKVGPRCANPRCGKLADHAHHVVRRSQLGGDYAWIKLHGQVRGNLVALCFRCHEDITGNVGGHKAAIRFNVADSLFYWCDVNEVDRQIEYAKVGPLEPQPPTHESLSERTPGQGNHESEHCPLCGQTKQRRREPVSPPGDRRRRRSWTVSVPDDAENGAEVLDTFTSDLADLLGAGDWSERNKRYWVLSHLFVWVLQRREEFAHDVSEADAA